MKIGDLARHSGLSASRIRFYEASGLLQPPVRLANGYRVYGDDALVTLQLIVGAQSAGFSLDEVRALLPTHLRGWQHGALVDALDRKVAEIDRLRASLDATRAQLLALRDAVHNKPEGLACADNARRVAVRMGAQAEAPAPAVKPRPAPRPAARRAPARAATDTR